MKYAQVRGIRFQIWNQATQNDVAQMLNEYNTGMIVVCPICRHIDIDPYAHFQKCDPEAEQDRIEAQEVFWK